MCGLSQSGKRSHLLIGFCLVWLTTSLSGCGTEPYAAQSNQVLTPDEARYRQVLNASEQGRLESAFEELAQNHVAVDPPRPRGLRWADVPAAVSQACGEAEMAVVNVAEFQWGYRYTLLTVEDYPATLMVRKTNDAKVYAAEATVGRFDDHPDRAATLLNALDESMVVLGKKRSFAQE
jgi:hypothetical protein